VAAMAASNMGWEASLDIGVQIGSAAWQLALKRVDRQICGLVRLMAAINFSGG